MDSDSLRGEKDVDMSSIQSAQNGENKQRTFHDRFVEPMLELFQVLDRRRMEFLCSLVLQITSFSREN